jgi:UDP-2-acetamido-2,6-beta-L-arabino-hexul-4-ose reductase
MINIGITGQSGFLGSHLYNTLGLYPTEFNRILFEDSYFERIESLSSFVSKCDIIVHLAAVNRHSDPDFIYHTNIDLVKKLIDALDLVGSHPHILISSSIQEDTGNPYGRSKKEGRELMAKWSEKKGSVFTGLVFPNIFGPFGKPFYNSFIATFSHQLTHNEAVLIDNDKNVPLIYVADAVKTIIEAVRGKANKIEYRISDITERKVSDILTLLMSFKSSYLEHGIIPELIDLFEINLFNTFRSFINIKQNNPVYLKLKLDDRGSFVETIRTKLGGQLSFSTTIPGITRGNHFHTRKIERFAVIKGKARIQLRKIGTSEVLDLYLSGDEPSYVDIPIWYTHNITNTGDEDLYTIFWINEFYNPEDPDTFFEQV